SSVRCSSRCPASALPFRGAPTRMTRSAGGVTSIIWRTIFGLLPFRCRALGELPPPGQPFLHLRLEAEAPRLVEGAPPERLGQIVLREVVLRRVVGIAIPAAVAELLHQTGRRVPEMHRHRRRRGLAGRREGGLERDD